MVRVALVKPAPPFIVQEHDRPKYPCLGLAYLSEVLKAIVVEEYEMATRREGGYRIISEKWEDYDKQFGNTLELDGLTREQLEKWQRKAYLTFFLKNLPTIKNHAVGDFPTKTAVEDVNEMNQRSNLHRNNVSADFHRT